MLSIPIPSLYLKKLVPKKSKDLYKVTNLVKLELMLFSVSLQPSPMPLLMFRTCAVHFTWIVSLTPLPHCMGSVLLLSPLFFLIGNLEPRDVLLLAPNFTTSK